LLRCPIAGHGHLLPELPDGKHAPVRGAIELIEFHSHSGV